MLYLCGPKQKTVKIAMKTNEELLKDHRERTIQLVEGTMARFQALPPAQKIKDSLTVFFFQNQPEFMNKVVKSGIDAVMQCYNNGTLNSQFGDDIQTASEEAVEKWNRDFTNLRDDLPVSINP